MFDSVLVANRGEIAVRVMTACQEVGIRTVAVYSDIDRHALHVRRADEAYAIGPAPAAESYLNISAIIAAARGAGAQAIHPGYGFLSENAEFAQACAAAQLVFIGPPPAAMRLMGSKIAAKRAVELAGVPTVPGYAGPARDTRGLLKEAQRIGFPVLIKAAAGGGGKGMREVNNPRDFAEALEAARREALAAFGDDTIFLEKLLVAPRHVEFQILADAQGNTVHLGERESSIQPRHQKILEESPACASIPAWRLVIRRRCTTIRCSPNSLCMRRTAPRRSRVCGGRWTTGRCWESPPICPCCGRSWPTVSSSPGTPTPAFCRDETSRRCLRPRASLPSCSSPPRSLSRTAPGKTRPVAQRAARGRQTRKPVLAASSVSTIRWQTRITTSRCCASPACRTRYGCASETRCIPRRIVHPSSALWASAKSRCTWARGLKRCISRGWSGISP